MPDLEFPGLRMAAWRVGLPLWPLPVRLLTALALNGGSGRPCSGSPPPALASAGAWADLARRYQMERA